jgi:hypothetical protein
LLHQLLNHLPKSVNIGLLYDIACQLHSNCVKWDFLKEDLTCVEFDIVVFYALLIIGPVNLFTILVSVKALVSQMAKAMNIFGVT